MKFELTAAQVRNVVAALKWGAQAAEVELGPKSARKALATYHEFCRVVGVEPER